VKAAGEMLRRKVEADLMACIGCHECLHVCPVASPDLRIADLNAATLSSEPASKRIQRFVWECFQCGQCVPVCPSGLERDAMVLWQKAQGQAQRPQAYTDHLQLKGAGGPVGKQVGIALHNLQARTRIKGLSQYVDKRTLRVADTLFFFGCNIFSDTGVPAKLLALADYLGCNYEVLGGMRSCCGWPNMLSGDLARADQMMTHVFERVTAAAPKEVVTIGAECYTALKRMVAINGDHFTPVTAASWIRRNLHRFPIRRLPDAVTFHDACHISRKLGEGAEARRILRQFGYLVEMPECGENGACCGYHQFDANPRQLEQQRNKHLAMAKATGATTMVVECVRCLEAYRPLASASGIQVLDLIDLLYETLRDDDGPVQQPVHFKSPLPQGRNGAVEGI